MRTHRGGGLLVALALAACAGAPPKTPPPSEAAAPAPQRIEDLLPEVEQLMQQRFEASGVPGMAAGIVYRGQLIWSHGYGVRDLNGREPVTADTVFRIGSITKVFTGLALLQLRDTGKLRLDDPVSLYLPEIQGVVYPTSEHPPILIRHLVTHGSGLPRFVAGLPTPMTPEELLASLRGLTLEFTPGTQNEYSNLAMGLAGLVVARAGGRPYREQIQERILDPLGMKASVWEDRYVPQGVLATGYERGGGANWKPIGHPKHDAVEAAGGLYSSVADLARFAAFELQAWPPRDAPESPILSRNSLRESQLMGGPQRPTRGGGWAWGINWGLQNDLPLGYRINHNGSISGYSGWILLLPDRDLGLIFLCSAGAGELRASLDPMLGDVATRLETVVPPRAPTLTPLMSGVLESLVRAVNDDSPDLQALFSKEWLDWLAPQTLPPMMQKFREQVGRCRIDHVLVGGVTRGKVALSCDRGAGTFDVSVLPRAPHLISSFGWTY